MTHSEVNDKRQALANNPAVKQATDLFHQIYYHASHQTWNETYWMGVPTLKCPLDMWVYQEIIYETRPDLIIETGTYHGGSALYMAMICDAIGSGKVVTIDVLKRDPQPEHSRLEYILGSSTSTEVVSQVESMITEDTKVMVILDSEHKKEHVLHELAIYSEYVKKGDYLIVEDTNINGHPVRPSWGAGPMEAVEEFMRTNYDFEIDKSREKFLMTQNPRGFLKKIM